MISDQALSRWAALPGPAVEEGLVGEIGTALVGYAAHHRLQLDKVPWLDLNAGHGIPAMLFQDVPWGYHALIRERPLYEAVKGLGLKHAFAECCTLDAMLGFGLKEPVAVLSACAGFETVADDRFIPLESYQRGERHWMVLAGHWLAKQRHKAGVVALVTPKTTGVALADTRTIQGEAQTLHLWVNPRLVKPGQHWVAGLAPNPWRWQDQASWLDAAAPHLVRKGDHLEPRYADADDVLRLMGHIWTSVPEHEAWVDKAKVRLTGLQLDHLAAQPDWATLQATLADTLGGPVVCAQGVASLLRKRQRRVQQMMLAYPDNGSQECRYWLLTVGDRVRGSEGQALEVTQYLPSAKTGQAPTIHLEEG